jgi:HSP20 family molecular chaperone IbpA
MNPFVDPNKRSVTLPTGCKDLIDVLTLQQTGNDFEVAATDVSFVITGWLPALQCRDVEITVEKNIIHVTGKKCGGSVPFDSTIAVPAGYDPSRACARYLNGELRIVIPKSEEAV